MLAVEPQTRATEESLSYSNSLENDTDGKPYEGVKTVSDSDSEASLSFENGKKSVALATHPRKKKWSQRTSREKKLYIWGAVWKTVAILGSLYVFLVGLALLSTAFRVLAGPGTGSLFSFIDQPMAGLMAGMIMTVVLQSSSTTTSLTVGLVASGELSVENAIPVVMGANIGTSVTNTLVSLAHIRNPAEFERAFSGATVHDFFNMLTVAVLLPIEIITHMIEEFSAVLIEPLAGASDFPSPIKEIVDPAAELFLKRDSCMQRALTIPLSRDGGMAFFLNCVDQCGEDQCPDTYEMATTFADCVKCSPDGFTMVKAGMFVDSGLSDTTVGILSAVIAVVLVVASLLALVKVLGIVLKGVAAEWFKKSLRLNAYIAMLIGAVVTIIIQSSSITTSTLVPLVGHGAITLEQMFPTTLGANIGTTFTGLIAASASGKPEGLQIALCHLIFNVFGIIIFYPIRYIRAAPLECARSLGYQVKRRRWVAAVYMLSFFLVIPVVLLALSLSGTGGLVVSAILLYGAIVTAFVWRQIRVRRPDLIPEWLPPLFHPNDRKPGPESVAEDVDTEVKKADTSSDEGDGSNGGESSRTTVLESTTDDEFSPRMTSSDSASGASEADAGSSEPNVVVDMASVKAEQGGGNDESAAGGVELTSVKSIP